MDDSIVRQTLEVILKEEKKKSADGKTDVVSYPRFDSLGDDEKSAVMGTILLCEPKVRKLALVALTSKKYEPAIAGFRQAQADRKAKQ